MHRKNDLLRPQIFFPVTEERLCQLHATLIRIESSKLNNASCNIVDFTKLRFNPVWSVTVFLRRVPMWWMSKLFLIHSCLNQITCVLLLISLEYKIWCCNLHFTTFLGGNNSFLSFVACDNSICFESNGVDGRSRVFNVCDLRSERLFCSTFCCWSKRQHPKLKDADVKPFYFSTSKC